MNQDNGMREKLSDIEHTRWSGWQAYLHSKCIKNADGSLTIPAGYVFHLERLINTPYNKLTEKEKDSDRVEANKTLLALKKELLGMVGEEKTNTALTVIEGFTCIIDLGGGKFLIGNERDASVWNTCRSQMKAKIEEVCG
jgi:hypothetical protein